MEMSSELHTCAVACTHTNHNNNNVLLQKRLKPIPNHVMESYENQEQRKYVK